MQTSQFKSYSAEWTHHRVQWYNGLFLAFSQRNGHCSVVVFIQTHNAFSEQFSAR